MQNTTALSAPLQPFPVFSLATKKPFAEPKTSIDWLEFTLFTAHTPADVLELLGCSGLGLEQSDRGLLGYRGRHSAGPITILTDGTDGMGTHVIVPGGALRELGLDAMAILGRLAEMNGPDYLTPLEHAEDEAAKFLLMVNRIFEAGPAGVTARRFKLSRLDVALDDFSGRLNMPLFIDSLKSGRVSSRARKFGVFEGGEIATGAVTARTYYLGKRGSNSMARLYDKRQEQIDKGADPADLPEIWNRFELELRNESAENAARLILAAGAGAGRIIRGMINNYAAVKLQTADTNKSRWPVATWWECFVDTADKIKVGKEIKRPDLPARKKWFERQCATSAAMLAIGYGRDYLKQAIYSASHRINERRRDEAETFAADRLATAAPKVHRSTACPKCQSGFTVALNARKSDYACEVCGQLFHTAAGRPHHIDLKGNHDYAKLKG